MLLGYLIVRRPIVQFSDLFLERIDEKGGYRRTRRLLIFV